MVLVLVFELELALSLALTLTSVTLALAMELMSAMAPYSPPCACCSVSLTFYLDFQCITPSQRARQAD